MLIRTVWHFLEVGGCPLCAWPNDRALLVGICIRAPDFWRSSKDWVAV